MSLALGHFAFGAMLTALVVALFGSRIPFPRTVVLLGGVWALVPDAAKLAPGNPRLIAFHDGPWADLFWLHQTLDRVDLGDSPRVSALLVAVFIFVTLLTEYRAYRMTARLHTVTVESEHSSRGG
jgi:hypothetical protein